MNFQAVCRAAATNNKGAKMRLVKFFCIVLMLNRVSASTDNDTTDCSENFPKIIVQTLDLHSREAKYMILATNLCKPDVLIEGTTAENSTIASDPRTSTVCYQNPSENSRFSCAVNGTIAFHLEVPLSIDFLEKNLSSIDIYGQNLYWHQRLKNGFSHLFATDMRTKASKVVWTTSRVFLHTEMDPVHGIMFYAGPEFESFPHSFWRIHNDTETARLLFTGNATIQTGIAVDWQAQRVYYGFDNNILHMDYEGGNQELFTFDSATSPIVPGSIKYYEKHLYFLRGNATLGYTLYKFNWESKHEVKRYIGLKQKEVRQVQIYETFEGKEENPCNALKCSHLCIHAYNSSVKAICGCPSYMKMDLANGNTCQGPSLTILMETTTEALDQKSVMEHSVLFLNGSQLGVERTHNGEAFPEVDGKFGLVTAFEDNAKCFKRKTGDFKCLKEGKNIAGTDPWQFLDPATASERRVMGANFAVNGTVLIHNNQTKCVEILNTKTGNLWNSLCSPELGSDSKKVAADPRYMQFMWTSSGGSQFRYNQLFSNSTLVVTEWFARKDIEDLNFDPESHTLVFRRNDTLERSQNKGMDTESMILLNLTSFIGSLSYSRGKNYWVETGPENRQYVATHDVQTGIIERIFQAPESARILDFSVGRTSDAVYDCSRWDANLCVQQQFNNPCKNSDCSHGCMPDPQMTTTPLCFCPSGLVLLNGKNCTDPGFIVAVRAQNSNETRLKVVSHKWISISTPFQGLDLKLDGAEIQATVDICTSDVQWTVCWITNQSQVLCKSSITKIMSHIGQTLSSKPFLKLSDGCDRVYWKLNDEGCFKVTMLKDNKTFSFPCAESLGRISSRLVDIDTERSVLFSWQNGGITYMPLGDEGPYPTVRLRDEDGAAIQSADAIALNIRDREVLIFYRNSTKTVGYNFFKNNAPEPSTTAMFFDKVSSAKVGHFLHADGGLFWAGSQNDRGVIYFVPDYSLKQGEGLDSDSEIHAKSIGHPWILHEANPYEEIISFRMLLPDNGYRKTLAGNASPCKTYHCSGLCYETDITSQDSKISCKCPDGTIRVDSKCISTSAGETDTGSVGTSLSADAVMLIVVGSVVSLLAIFLCIIGAWYFKWMKKRNEQIHTALNLLSGTLSKGEPYATNLGENTLAVIESSPFTKVIPVSDISISITKVLGEGHYGIVYAGHLRGDTVAVKALKPGCCGDLLIEFIREIKVMEYVGHHEHIVEFHGAEISSANRGRVFVALELSPYGSLENYLRLIRNKSTPMIRTSTRGFTRYVKDPLVNVTIELDNLNLIDDVRDGAKADDVALQVQVMCSWAGQIASGMAYLEEKGVVHGDLATRNVLVFENNVVKISDFGYSRNIYQYNTYVKKKSVPLPWRWSAIETLERLEFSSKADVWAYGVTLWEIFSFGNLPFPNCNWNQEFVNQLRQGMRLQKPQIAPQELFDRVMMPAWSIEPTVRPSFAEVCDILENLKNELEDSDQSELDF